MSDALRTLQAQFPGAGQFDKLRCDNGTDFVSTEMEEISTRFSIVHEPAEPYTHEHNGTVERLNRTLEERTRALILESGFPANLWGTLIHTACWLYNRTPHSSIEFLIPYEKFYGNQPDLKQIKVIGSSVEVLNETLPAGKKFEPRSYTCYLIGFTKTGYIVFDPKTRKMINSCNVKIDETKLYKNEISENKNREELRFPDTIIENVDNQAPLDTSSVTTKSDEESDTEVISVELDYDWDTDENPKVNNLKMI